jgi:tetratricopeptide (TPR) repeat protein
MDHPPQAAAVGLATAVAALNNGELSQAHAWSLRLLELTPDDPAVLQLAAAVALAMDRGEDASRSARASLARRPDHVPTLVLAGRAARLGGDLAEAVTCLRRAASLEPGRAEAAFLLCVTLLEQGEKEANAMLQDLLERFPNEASGWRMLGDSLSAMDKPDAALSAYARAAQGKAAPAVHLRRATILQSQGRYGEALADYAAAAALAPERAEVTLRRALCLKQMRDTDGARLGFEEATLHESTAALAYFELGLIEQDRGHFPAAVKFYEEALARRPELAEGAVNLGICLQGMGDLAGAKEAYARALGLRADTFGRIAQALASSPTGELWLDHRALRRSLLR